MKVLILLVFLNIFVLASVEKTQSFYDVGEYEKALQEAKDSKSEYSNHLLHLLWAKSAEALGLANEAMSAYERVVMLQEDNIDAMVALVKIYSDSQRFGLASTMKESLDSYQLSEEQKSIVKLAKGDSVHSLKASAKLNLGFDSNINASPDSELLNDYLDINSSDGALSTTFAKLTAQVAYTNEFGGKGGWYAKGNFLVNHQHNLAETFYNMSIGSGEIGIGYRGSEASIYLPLSYNSIYYIEKDLFAQQKINPRVTFSMSESSIFNMNIAYAKRNFIQESDKVRDDTKVGLGVGVYYLYGKDYTYLNGKFENFSANNDNPGSYVKKNMLSASAGFSYELYSWLNTKVDYRLRIGLYDDDIGTDSNPDNDARLDTYQQVELKLSHIYSNGIEAYISDKYIQNVSNYLPSEYTKNVVMLGFGINY